MTDENLPALAFHALTAEQRASVLAACEPNGTLTQREAVGLRYRVRPASGKWPDVIVPVYGESDAPRDPGAHHQSADVVLCLHRERTDNAVDLMVAKRRGDAR